MLYCCPICPKVKHVHLRVSRRPQATVADVHSVDTVSVFIRCYVEIVEIQKDAGTFGSL